MKNELDLIPSYWASVSGGKDSLFMLKLILNNPKKYPLNGVVHFELEIDYPFIHNVINYMKSECLKYNIHFVSIKPDKTFIELYNKLGYPTRKNRWCNSDYKLSAYKKLKKFLNDKGYKCISYIGYCYDEFKRYDKRNNVNEIYPLVNEKIYENDILLWAQKLEIYNKFYIFNRRCGCMYCPLQSYINFAYLYKFYPEQFNYMISLMKKTENELSIRYNKPFSCISSDAKYNSSYLEYIIKNKYVKILENKEKFKQIEINFLEV